MYIRYGSCQSADVACDGDFCGTQSQTTIPNPAPGNYYIFVDGYMTHSGGFTLTVTTVP